MTRGLLDIANIWISLQDKDCGGVGSGWTRKIISSGLAVVVFGLNAAAVTPSPVAWWNFDDPNNPGLDSVGGNNAFAYGSPLPTITAGHSGLGAISLNGNGQFLAVQDAPALDITGPLTIMLWAKPNAVNANYPFVYKASSWDDGQMAYALDLHYSEGFYPRFWVSSDGHASGVSEVISPVALQPGGWHLIAAVYTGSSLNIYVDGQLQASTAYSGNIYAGNDPLYIGANWNFTWNGALDEVRLFNVALSSDDIRAMYVSELPSVDVAPLMVGPNGEILAPLVDRFWNANGAYVARPDQTTTFTAPQTFANYTWASNQIDFVGSPSNPYAQLLQFYRGDVHQPAAVRWFQPDGSSCDIGLDVTVGNFWYYHDSVFDHDLLKIGLGNSPYPGRFQIGVGGLEPGSQLYIVDADTNVLRSLYTVSQNDGARFDSLSQFSDAVTVRRGFDDGGNWIHWNRGATMNGLYDWRLGLGLDSQGAGSNLVFYGGQGAIPSSSSPGTPVFSLLSAGGIAWSGTASGDAGGMSNFPVNVMLSNRTNTFTAPQVFGDITLASNRFDFVGSPDNVNAQLLQFYRSDLHQSSAIRWFQPDGSSCDIGMDVGSTGDFWRWHDSTLQDLFSIGLGGSANPGRFGIGPSGLDLNSQLFLSDVDDNVLRSLYISSRNGGIRLDSASQFADAITVKRGFDNGGNWFHWYSGRGGNGAYDWRLGFVPGGVDLAFYNGQGVTPSASSPGTEVFRAIATGGVQSKVFIISGTTNQLVFGATNAAPANPATPVKWVSVQVNGEGTAYSLPLYQ